MYKKIVFLIVFLMLVSPVLAYDNTTIECADNVTVLENISVYKDGNQSWYAMYTTCSNGCDNVTYSCSPPAYISSLYGLAIGVGFLVALMVFLSWLRKR